MNSYLNSLRKLYKTDDDVRSCVRFPKSSVNSIVYAKKGVKAVKITSSFPGTQIKFPGLSSFLTNLKASSRTWKLTGTRGILSFKGLKMNLNAPKSKFSKFILDPNKLVSEVFVHQTFSNAFSNFFLAGVLVVQSHAHRQLCIIAGNFWD